MSFEFPIQRHWIPSTEEGNKSGYASFILGNYHSESFWLPDLSFANLIGDLIEKAYEGGRREGALKCRNAMEKVLKELVPNA